ncbi:unnamed protein product [Aphanomyces euteiches]
MINVREFQALQTQLLKEGNERFELQEQNKQLSSRVKVLERDLSKKEYELAVATASKAISTSDDVHELIETNLALKEQVRVMKEALDAMQTEAASPPPPSSSNDFEPHDDLQSLLAKLSAKEEELSAIREECRMWEEQVIQLKFELQSERFTSQETAKELAQKPKKEVDTTAMKFPNAKNELQEYKALAMQRAEYWKLAEMALDKANIELGALKAQNKQLQARLDELEKATLATDNPEHPSHRHSSLTSEGPSSELEEARQQAALAQTTLTAAMKEVARLEKELQDLPKMYEIELRKAKHLAKELQKEVHAQKSAEERGNPVQPKKL